MPPKKRLPRDNRLSVIVGAITGVLLVGYLISLLPGRGVNADSSAPFATIIAQSPPPQADGRREEATPDAQARSLTEGARKALDKAAAALQSEQFDRAIETLNSSRSELEEVASAYQMLGRALEGKKDFETARDFYTAAIDRDPLLADAYWGVAATSEALGDLEAAIGAMRTYLHVEPDKHPDRLRIAQARSALWEWEAQLGKGPWGPTKGIPPGYTADDLKRDGRGVATRVAIPGTERPDGTAQAEIKHADKQVIFPRP